MQEALHFARRYLKDVELAKEYIDHLANYTNDELETITTVDWIARELSERGEVMSVESIRHAIGGSEEWKSKLARENFSRVSIDKAIRQLQRMRLLPA